MTESTPTDAAKAIAATYDDLATTYDRNRGLFDLSEVLADFIPLLPPEGHLLDLGCGAGEPVASTFLSRGWKVTGVDLSSAMLALAQTHLPTMELLQADMISAELPSETFDAVTAVYSLFHVPHAQHAAVFSNVHRWLKPAGHFLFTYATKDYTGHARFDGTKEFMAHDLFYSHTTPAEMFDQLADARLRVINATDRNIGGETFLWVTAQRAC